MPPILSIEGGPRLAQRWHQSSSARGLASLGRIDYLRSSYRCLLERFHLVGQARMYRNRKIIHLTHLTYWGLNKITNGCPSRLHLQGIFLSENASILIEGSLKIVCDDLVDNGLAYVHTWLHTRNLQDWGGMNAVCNTSVFTHKPDLDNDI